VLRVADESFGETSVSKSSRLLIVRSWKKSTSAFSPTTGPTPDR
jgi:hypothetical protein